MSSFSSFEDLNCNEISCLDQRYQRAQETLHSYSVGANGTWGRCYKDPVLEHKMWKDSYSTRDYTEWDCLNSQSKCDNSPISYSVPCGDFFNVSTKRKGVTVQPPECCGDRKPAETVREPDYGWMFAPFQPSK